MPVPRRVEKDGLLSFLNVENHVQLFRGCEAWKSGAMSSVRGTTRPTEPRKGSSTRRQAKSHSSCMIISFSPGLAVNLAPPFPLLQLVVHEVRQRDKRDKKCLRRRCGDQYEMRQICPRGIEKNREVSDNIGYRAIVECTRSIAK